MVNFGFSDNSYIKNNFNTNTANSLENLIVAVRVIDIILDENHKRFNELGGWNALGTIEYELVTSPLLRPIDKKIILPIASPINSSLKNYPLINEIVYLISLPNTDIGKTNVSQKEYYINIVSLWNHPHHNAYPVNPNNPPPSQKKDYRETTEGSVRRVTDQSTEIFLGNTFNEKTNIHPLLPFEGDVIQEGRWGNSIRLGSTVSNTPNEWSNVGDNGDPITIIRNGQGKQTEEGWIPITEDINDNISSIYLTSTQQIPLEISNLEYTSYSGSIDQTPIIPKLYNEPQIVLNSGRLTFNAYRDHLLLTAAKSINLNAKKSVNIDTSNDGKVVIVTPKIFLGEESLTEPLMLGNSTVILLRSLVQSLKTLAEVLVTAETTNAYNGEGVEATPLNLPTINTAAVKLIGSLESLESSLGTSSENCELLSKRNFTL